MDINLNNNIFNAIDTLIKTGKIKSESEFYNEFKIDKSSKSLIKANKKQFPKSKLALVASKYGIRIDFLLKGELPIWSKITFNDTIMSNQQVNEPQADYKTGSLPIIKSDPNGKEIPFYETEIFATISPAMNDVVTLKPQTFIHIPMFSQGEYALQVSGHSMKGLINHGDWIVVKKITNIDAIIYGEPYLIVTKSDNLKTVKFVKQSEDDKHSFCLIPYNIEQFEPQDIKKKEVLEMYRVIGLFRTT